MEYSAGLNKEELCCEKVHRFAEKITMFIGVLNPAIQPLITRVREDNPSRSSFELVKIARDPGDAFCARGDTAVKLNTLLKENHNAGKGRKRDSAFFARSADDSWGHQAITFAFESNVDPLQMMTEVEDSIPTTDLTSTGSEVFHVPEWNPLLAMGYRTVPEPRFSFQDERSSAGNRRGWQDRRLPAENPRMGLICHACYEKKSHVRPKYSIPLKDIRRVVTK